MQAIRAHTRKLGHSLTPFYRKTYDENDGEELIACCTKCGRRINGGYNRGDEALDGPCDGNEARALESGAWLTGHAPRLLLRRLARAVQEMDPRLHRFFDPGDFHAGNQWLLSEDGVWRLKRYLRDLPDFPVDDENPQPPEGLVELQRLVPAAQMRAARYVGKRHNPNIGDDTRYWLVQPLEPGTRGVAYQVDDDRSVHWRFRRQGGVTGYYVASDDIAFDRGVDTPQSNAIRTDTAGTGNEQRKNHALDPEDPDEDDPWPEARAVSYTVCGVSL